MAKNRSIVYLGFEDEEVTDKHAALLNSTVNKIGGTADWPSGEIKVSSCPLCGTARPLIVQLYAPLDLSQFHRSLYVFACLNPACSQNSKSWTCVRTQHLDTAGQAELISVTTGANKKKKSAKQKPAVKMTWCSGADDWGDDAVIEVFERMDTGADDFQLQNEENGNVIAKNDNSPTRSLDLGGAANGCSLIAPDEDEDDDEDESNSMENDLLYSFGQLEMHSPQNSAEDPNANCAAGAGAVIGGAGASASTTTSICAEIEGPETDVVLVETPKKPERDLIALLKHTPSSAALGPLANITDVTLKSYFIVADLEQRKGKREYEDYSGALSADHIRDLYQEYKRQDETAHSPNGGAVGGDGVIAAGGKEEQECYEKELPAHGDLIFHHFVSTVQQNQGQILRYTRDTLPLLIAPLGEPVPKCPNCNGETICEVQILSTLISKLQLQQNNEPAPIEYGNVLVFTCLKSCWDTPDKMRYERIIVQPDK